MRADKTINILMITSIARKVIRVAGSSSFCSILIAALCFSSANAGVTTSATNLTSGSVITNFGDLCVCGDDAVLLMDEGLGLTVHGETPSSYNYKIGFSVMQDGVVTFVGHAGNQDMYGEHPEWGQADQSGMTGFYSYNGLGEDTVPTGLWVILDANNDGIGTITDGIWTLGDDDVLYTAGLTSENVNNIIIGGVLGGVANLPAYDSNYIYTYDGSNPDNYRSLDLPSVNLVPEPATFVLFGGVAAVMIWARRRRSF